MSTTAGKIYSFTDSSRNSLPALAEEINLAQRYLAIEALRLGDRLQVEWQVAEDAPRELRMPRLVLQPLLENAVIHGIAPLAKGGLVSIAINVQGGRLRIRVSNPAGSPSPLEEGNHHAQDSIEQRLAYHFGTGARLSRRFENGIYECEIELPLP